MVVLVASYCKFANVFLAKTLKRSIRQSFAPPTFCAIRYYALMFQNYLIMFLEHDTYTDAQAVMKLFDRLKFLVLLFNRYHSL